MERMTTNEWQVLQFGEKSHYSIKVEGDTLVFMMYRVNGDDKPLNFYETLKKHNIKIDYNKLPTNFNLANWIYSIKVYDIDWWETKNLYKNGFDKFLRIMLKKPLVEKIKSRKREQYHRDETPCPILDPIFSYKFVQARLPIILDGQIK